MTRIASLFALPSLALAFTLARPTALSATPWDADAAPPLDAAARALGAQPWTWEPLPDAEAVCLDGSQYGVVTCVGAGPIKTTYINIQGGGCESRGAARRGAAWRNAARRGAARRGATWRSAALCGSARPKLQRRRTFVAHLMRLPAFTWRRRPHRARLVFLCAQGATTRRTASAALSLRSAPRRRGPGTPRSRAARRRRVWRT